MRRAFQAYVTMTLSTSGAQCGNHRQSSKPKGTPQQFLEERGPPHCPGALGSGPSDARELSLSPGPSLAWAKAHPASELL